MQKKFNNNVNNILPFIDLFLIKKGGKVKVPISDIYNRMYQENYDRPDAQKFVKKFRAFMNNRGYNVDIVADNLVISDPTIEREGEKEREERRQKVEEYHFNELLFDMFNDNIKKELEELKRLDDIEKTEEDDNVYNLIMKRKQEIFDTTGVALTIGDIIIKSIKRSFYVRNNR